MQKPITLACCPGYSRTSTLLLTCDPACLAGPGLKARLTAAGITIHEVATRNQAADMQLTTDAFMFVQQVRSRHQQQQEQRQAFHSAGCLVCVSNDAGESIRSVPSCDVLSYDAPRQCYSWQGDSQYKSVCDDMGCVNSISSTAVSCIQPYSTRSVLIPTVSTNAHLRTQCSPLLATSHGCS
jgi:hypothetical protein